VLNKGFKDISADNIPLYRTLIRFKISESNMNIDTEFMFWMKKLDEVEPLILPENYTLFYDHITDITETVKKRTVINHIVILIPFSKWCQKPLKELTKRDMGQYFATFNGKADSTIRVNKATVRNFLNNINQEVAGTIKTKRHKSKTSPDDLLTDGDIEALINAAPTNRDRALIACLFDSGARKGELLSTTIADVKFDENGCILWLREGKTGPRPARLIYAASFLREWLNVHPRKDELSAPIFCSLRSPHNVISRTGLFEQLEIIKKKAGVTKPINPHNFRHSRATDLARKLRSEQKLKAVLGWTPGSPMAGIYIHLSGVDISDAMLEAAGIKKEETEEIKLSVGRCPRCKELAPARALYCGKCGLPLTETSAQKMAQINNTLDLEFLESSTIDPALLKLLAKELKNVMGKEGN
jgi:integrase/recombinase XerD